jgi:hypothetical protein
MNLSVAVRADHHALRNLLVELRPCHRSVFPDAKALVLNVVEVKAAGFGLAAQDAGIHLLVEKQPISHTIASGVFSPPIAIFPLAALVIDALLGTFAFPTLVVQTIFLTGVLGKGFQGEGSLTDGAGFHGMSILKSGVRIGLPGFRCLGCS